MLRFAQDEGVLTRIDALRYIGQRFQIKSELPPWVTEETVCEQLMKYILQSFQHIYWLTLSPYREHICVHLDRNIDKFNILMWAISTSLLSLQSFLDPHTFSSFMSRKLYALSSGRCSPESADSPMNQEILLGGHLYLMILKVSITHL